MSPLLGRFARLGFRRGMRANSRGWLAFSALVGLASWARKRAKAPPKLLHREVLEPGEAITITVLEPER
jgi:hypothetical protein